MALSPAAAAVRCASFSASSSAFVCSRSAPSRCTSALCSSCSLALGLGLGLGFGFGLGLGFGFGLGLGPGCAP